MKITKSRLQQIIQEELSRVLSEAKGEGNLVVITKVVSSVTTSPVGRPQGSRRVFYKTEKEKDGLSNRVYTADAARAVMDQKGLKGYITMPVAAAIVDIARSLGGNSTLIGLLRMDAENPITLSDVDLSDDTLSEVDLSDDLASDVDLPDDLAATFKQHKEDEIVAKGIGDRLAQIAGIFGASRTHAREDVMYSEDYDAVAAFKPDPVEPITITGDDEDGTIQRGKFFGEEALKVVVTSPSENTMIYVAGP